MSDKGEKCDKGRQFLEKVNQCFSEDSEQRAAAEQVVESQLTEDEVRLARSYSNLLASDRRPRWLMIALSIVMILVWMALVFIPAYRLSKTGSDFVTAIDYMQSMDGDYHTWLLQSSYFSDHNEADLLLLFGDYKRATKSDRLKGAWESEPDNPGLYIEYLNVYVGHFESYPTDMLTVAERIDPENALFPTLQLAEMADACTKKVDSAESESTPSISPVLRKHYAITDMTKHQAAMDLFYTIVKMPRLESHTLALHKRRLPLIQRDEQDWLTRWMPLGYLYTLTVHSLRYQKVINLIRAEAYRCEREKDAEALKRLIPAWQAFCRMQHTDILTLVDGIVLRACIESPCEDFAAAAKACGLEEVESGFVALRKQRDAENEARYNVPDEISFSADKEASILSQLSMDVVAKQVNDRNKLPAPNTGPDRRADHAFFNGLVAALACLMLVLSAMVVWLRTFRRDHLLRILGRRLSATFATRDWVAVFIYGVLLPIGIYWLVNGTDSLLSAQRYALLNVTPLGQPVSLLLMLLVAPVIAITYRLNHVLPVEQRKVSKCLCSAAVLALLAMPLFGLVLVKGQLVILGHSMQILACVLVLVALIGSYRRNKKEGGGSLFRAVRSQLLVPLYVSASLIMALHVSIYYGIEKYWVAEDELWKLSGDTVAPSSFEEVVTRQLSDELDVLLKQIETDFPFDPVNK
ncbi:MAG: hypothetical protein GWP68_01650 [Verrucomicrobiaceae bacterium]|nr:hypothetical protein [Verrucomicrobiaceae bacterium]